MDVKEGWIKLINKPVFIKLKTGRQYSGKIKNIDKLFIDIVDKNNKNVSFAISEIAIVQEEEEYASNRM
jgi:small nuclear ribonucleoprotein (snRNP)-like protein